MVSHELRAPPQHHFALKGITAENFAQLSATQKPYNLQRIHLTAQQMSQQISDLLTLIRAEVGKLEFNPKLLDAYVFIVSAGD